MSGITWLSLLFIIGFVFVHLGAKHLQLNTSNPRSPWLSFFGGGTIAYVFLYLLPELHKYLQVMKKTIGDSWLSVLGDYTYLLALIGLLSYYGLVILANRKKKLGDEESASRSFPVFLVHMSAFFLYNMVIGYLLIRNEFASHWDMVIYFLALGAHVIATDYTMKAIHEEDYDKYGRWFLTGAVFIGWLIGVLFKIPETIVGIAVSLLVGGILLNIFKDELRENTPKGYIAFLGGALAITLLTMLVGS